MTKKHLKKNTLDIKDGDELSVDFVNEVLFEYEFEEGYVQQHKVGFKQEMLRRLNQHVIRSSLKTLASRLH